MACMEQDGLCGVLCYPFLSTWFVHQRMASGFLSLERIKTLESFSSSPGEAGAAHTAALSEWICPLLWSTWAISNEPLPKLLPSGAASCSSPSPLFLCMNCCLFLSELTLSIPSELLWVPALIRWHWQRIWFEAFPGFPPAQLRVCCHTAE